MIRGKEVYHFRDQDRDKRYVRLPSPILRCPIIGSYEYLQRYVGPIDACDDNPTAYRMIIAKFQDQDSDGFTTSANKSFCVGSENKAPAPYTLESRGEDCNDIDAKVGAPVAINSRDGDGFFIPVEKNLQCFPSVSDKYLDWSDPNNLVDPDDKDPEIFPGSTSKPKLIASVAILGSSINSRNVANLELDGSCNVKGGKISLSFSDSDSKTILFPEVAVCQEPEIIVFEKMEEAPVLPEFSGAWSVLAPGLNSAPNNGGSISDLKDGKVIVQVLIDGKKVSNSEGAREFTKSTTSQFSVNKDVPAQRSQISTMSFVLTGTCHYNSYSFSNDKIQVLYDDELSGGYVDVSTTECLPGGVFEAVVETSIRGIFGSTPIPNGMTSFTVSWENFETGDRGTDFVQYDLQRPGL